MFYVKDIFFLSLICIKNKRSSEYKFKIWKIQLYRIMWMDGKMFPVSTRATEQHLKCMQLGNLICAFLDKHFNFIDLKFYVFAILHLA